jgi:hypothetical protein
MSPLARPIYAAVLLLPALLAPPAWGEGLWDRVKEGTARTLERSGELVREGAAKGRALTEQGIEAGGELAGKGLKAGSELAGDTMGHFYRDGTPAEIRARVDAMAADTLDRLFADDREALLLFDRGYGYGVFEVRQVSMTVLAGYGYGVAASNDGSRRLYMKMATGGVEIAKGIGGFASQWVVLFADRAAFDDFVTEGLDAGASAGGTLGRERAGVEARYRRGIALYRVTQGGLKLAASLSGTRFWPDSALNEPGAPVDALAIDQGPAPVAEPDTGPVAEPAADSLSDRAPQPLPEAVPDSALAPAADGDPPADPADAPNSPSDTAQQPPAPEAAPPAH